jgi:hyperosmotically inducible periplasmic protein
MFVLTRKMLLAAGLAAFVLTGGVASADSVSQDIVDARQESQIWTTCALNPHLRDYRLQALVQSGMVRLTGTVAESVEKELAAEIAFGVKGVREVDNQILVQPGDAPPKQTAERSYAEAVDDAGVSAEVKSKIAWSRSSGGLHALIDTTKGVVRLRGTADSQASKVLAGWLAGTTRGVASVDNQLTVTGPQTPGAPLAGAAAPNVTDGWITSRVKSTLIYSINSSAWDVSVSASGGDVTLTGRARNGAERALAIELAQDVRGVRSVNPKGYTF